MASIAPDSNVPVPLLRQEWRTVTFVHWRYHASRVQPVLSPGLAVEEYDGSAWVTLTPLRMKNVRLPGTPPLPLLSSFAETNLRTYVRGPDGREGIWFFSLDAARAWIVLGARLLLGAPYFRADADIDARHGLRYRGARTGSAGPSGSPGPAYRLDVRPGMPIEPDGLEVWLTHRWRAYTRHAGFLLEIPVRHEPWPLRAATVTGLTESLTAAAGLPEPPDPPLAHFSAGVTGVTFGPARPVRVLARPRAG